MSFILLIVGFVLLIKCADMLVDGSTNLAKFFGVPTLIIGLTIVAFGTSAPEIAVSVTSALKGENAISLGNVIGANICNLLLNLGVSGLFGSLVVKRKIITRDFVYCIFSGLVLLILMFGSLSENGTGILTRTNGLILLCFFGVYLYDLIGEALSNARAKEEKIKFNFKDIILIILGIAGVIIGGELVVDSATKIATMLNISQHVIALTIVSIGTSLPELVTFVVATRKGETDLAIGNVVGSNIFNIFMILGLSTSISPIAFNTESLTSVIFLFLVSIGVYLLLLKNYRIGNKKGIILLATFIIYTIYLLVK